VAELAAVATHARAPVDLLAMSLAGPVAVALAATRPDLVRRLVFFGTYASAAEVFIRLDLSATLIALVRSHWGLGSKLLADLYRPDRTERTERTERKRLFQYIGGSRPLLESRVVTPRCRLAVIQCVRLTGQEWQGTR
jgi:pimeloyl-ACP methyl ester carboxylesterase